MQADQMQDQMRMFSQFLAGGMGVVVIISSLVSYLFTAFCLAKIGEKVGIPFGKGFLMSLIPIVNLIFIFQLGGKPAWWIILLIIPIVDLVVWILTWMSICERRGKPGWWGIVLFIPIVGLVLFLILAFGEAGNVPATT